MHRRKREGKMDREEAKRKKKATETGLENPTSL